RVERDRRFAGGKRAIRPPLVPADVGVRRRDNRPVERLRTLENQIAFEPVMTVRTVEHPGQLSEFIGKPTLAAGIAGAQPLRGCRNGAKVTVLQVFVGGLPGSSQAFK